MTANGVPIGCVIAGAPLIGVERPAYVEMTDDWANALKSNIARSVSDRKRRPDRVTEQRGESPRFLLVVTWFDLNGMVICSPSTVWTWSSRQPTCAKS